MNERTKKRNEHMNGQTERERYIPLGINARGIIKHNRTARPRLL